MVAEDLRTHPGLQFEARQILQQQRCEFLFGNTAPDVQVVSRQQREHTHFFTLPIQANHQVPWEALLAENPAVSRPATLPPEQAAFLAGYLCHLQADWFWIQDIFAPVFGPDAGWSSFYERLYLHNVLRAYLDQQVLQSLEFGIGACLKTVEPRGWLPFVEDGYLRAWRDFVSEQLQPGASVQTVEVFAERQGISPNEFYSLLHSEDQMDRQVFIHLPRSSLAAYRGQLLIENISLLNAFL